VKDDTATIATRYAERGYSVIPVDHHKVPLTSWTKCQNQIASREEIEGWFNRFPDAGVAIVTTNLSVVDADLNGGIKALNQILPENLEAPTADTPNDGRHYYFKCGPGMEVRNKVALMPGVDIRGTGGYVVAPPSRCYADKLDKANPNYGKLRPYHWLNGLDLLDFDEIPELPMSIYELYRKKTSNGGEEKPPNWREEIFQEGVKEGERNDTLMRLSASYLGKGLAETEILPLLFDANSRFDPPLSKKEVRTILTSMTKKHRQNHVGQERNLTEDIHPCLVDTYSNLNLPSSLEISQMEIRVDWAVKNLIPKESITLLHSIGGVGKSYLMYGVAKAVAEGEPFFGLDVMRMNVYYIDFENPLPEIVDRMKKMGGCENLRIWHLGHDPMPIRFDADEWETYKSFPPGLFIIDSLRSSHLLEENSSKDASFIMARHKEIRALGNTIILIHHESKAGGYRGSTAWFDLSDHILKFSRVKRIGSDEDTDEDDFNLPIRLGLGGKSRFSSAMELRPMYFRFENHQLCNAEDPEENILNQMAQLLNSESPPNQSEFQKLVKQNLGIGGKDFRKLLKKGENQHFWYARKSSIGNKFEYLRGVK
jgi:hypothetical protein